MARTVASIALLAAVLSAAAWLHAGEIGGPPPGPERAKVLELIAQLDAPEKAPRDAAETGLIEIGAGAIAPLRHALLATRSADFQARATKVLNRLIGPTIEGLALSLSVDKKTVKMGEEVVFTLAFWNVADKTINVPWGIQAGETKTNPGGFLCGVIVEGKEQHLGQPPWIGPPLPPAQPPKTLFQSIPPRTIIRVHIHCRYQDRIAVLSDGQEKMAEQDVLAVGQYWAFPVRQPCSRGFMVYFKIPPEAAKEPAGQDVDLKASFWTGELHSNEVEVLFERPAGELPNPPPGT
jgi:hypothetical protein